MAATTRAPAAAERLPASAAPDRGWRGHPALLAVALVLASTYAAFAAGATRYPQETRLELLLVLVALGAVVSWASGGGIGWRASRAAAVGLTLLVLLAAWTGVSLLWSITPDRTWLEANRAIAYVLVVALSLALGASDPRAIERTATLLLASATLVALYAFATKALPGLPGLDAPAAISRLREPLGYWNALALICALAVPIAIRIACDLERRRRERAAALAAGLLLVVVIGLTYSRGGVVAVGVGALVLTALGRARLRGLAVLGLLVAASVPALAVAFSLPGTSDNAVALSTRSSDGRLLGLTVLGCLMLLALGAIALRRVERRVAWSAARTRTVLRAAAVLVALGVLVATARAAVSDRGLPGTVADRIDAFTQPSGDDVYDPARLVTTTSGNRWAWWSEAVGAWSDRPVAGWGAGSFRATHLRYRVDELPVTQAHSVPLQLLAETGLVGLLLFAGGVGGLGLAAVGRWRALPDGRERDLAAAALAAAAAWLVHGLFDWDWNIPGVTVPALVLLGVLAARPGGEPRVRGAGTPVLGAVGAGFVLSLIAASALIPSWADSKASAAQVAVRATSDDAELAAAAARARTAARLDPVALRPLLAASAIARRRGRLLESRAFLLEAVERQPESAEAWRALANAAFALADRVGFERAALRALELDPRSPRARRLALAAVAYRTPSGASATAVGTPLTPAPVQAPVAPPPVAVPPVEPPAVEPPPAGAPAPTDPTGPGGAAGPTAP